MVSGFKAFNEDYTNRYGQVFEPGKLYESFDEVIKFQKTGFHFCKNLEDTLRYYDGFSEVKIAKVVGIGNIDEYEDDYYGYYDMYSSEKLYILYFLSREEIYDYILRIAEKGPFYVDRVIRFVSGFKITNEEKIQLLSAVKDQYQKQRLVKAIKYYQEGKINIYK